MRCSFERARACMMQGSNEHLGTSPPVRQRGNPLRKAGKVAICMRTNSTKQASCALRNRAKDSSTS
jgi:hypothetical protein